MAASQSIISAPGVSKSARWTGRVISGLIVLFMLFDGITKMMKVPQVMAATAQIQYPPNLIPLTGAIALICTILYAIPRTSIFGAILLTGYLGGAVVIQLRVSNPVFETVFPIIFAVLAWGALYLREPRLRALIPLRSKGFQL